MSLLSFGIIVTFSQIHVYHMWLFLYLFKFFKMYNIEWCNIMTSTYIFWIFKYCICMLRIRIIPSFTSHQMSTYTHPLAMWAPPRVRERYDHIWYMIWLGKHINDKCWCSTHILKRCVRVQKILDNRVLLGVHKP